MEKIDAYWRAANYLSVGQIYLLDNPLLRKPLELADVKPRLLGHFGTTPGLNFIYVHMNQVIKKHDLNVIFIAGPGHGGPALVANTYLEGTYSELYPEVTQDEAGLKKLFKQFSFPGGIPSHAAPETPGSINEGGELGYCLAHAFGAVLDNPDLIACCVVGDGEAETGPLAASWHSNKFLNPIRDGAVLPILHLNGYKIANPTVLARIDRKDLEALFQGYGYNPYFVEGSEPKEMHEKMEQTLEKVILEIKAIKQQERLRKWPMIILASPKGWTCPKEVDGKKLEGTWRSHQVPISDVKKAGHLKLLEEWLKSYRPEELFDEKGRFKKELQELAPKGEKRMGANPHANGGLLLKELNVPNFRSFAVDVKKDAEATAVLGNFLREVMRLNMENQNFRIMGPDETKSNKLDAVYEVVGKEFEGRILPTDEHLSNEGRVMEVLSEHLCQGWLEGYLLTGRHGLFSCYEAFIHIVDSMFNQHAKWLKVCGHIPWRKPIASLNYLLSSHVWRQDHNGFSHQDPGFLDVVVNKKSSVIRVYLPPDANTLLSIADHCLRSKNFVNVIVIGKQPAMQYLTVEEAVAHCTKGASIWPFASNGKGDPDVVMACCGDVPTMETLAAIDLLRKWAPDLKIRCVNVVDLMVLEKKEQHPHGLSDQEYIELFTPNKPIIFAFHGYPALIHKLTYKRPGHENMHVHGFKEEGTTTTPFDMTVLNELDRFNLILTVIHCFPKLSPLKERVQKKLEEHKAYIVQRGEDLPEIREWRWQNF